MKALNQSSKKASTKNVSGAGVTSPPTPTTSVAPPPNPNAVPTPPAGFVAPPGSVFTGVRPKKTELAAMPQALLDLQAFANFATVLGPSAPPEAQFAGAVGVAQKWSAARNAAQTWDAYCMTEEGLAWVTLRALMAQVGPAFEWASKLDPSLATQYAGLAAFLGAKKAIAKKGLATKAANKKAIANGEPATHGAVGKQRKKAAANAALAAQTATHSAASTSATPAVTAAPVATVTPAAAAPKTP